jgi:DNA polymerase-1
MRGLLKPGRWSRFVVRGLVTAGVRQRGGSCLATVNMMAAYASGDPYLASAKQAGAIPLDAIREDHEDVRDQFKECCLAVQYGMGDKSLALRINQTSAHARALLLQHRRTYHKFWAWNDRVLTCAICERRLQASFGWTRRLGKNIKERSVRNFPMQANGAEMMRIACMLAVEAGIQVCATVHDAFVIEAPIDEIAEAETRMQSCMVEASRLVLNGFELRSDKKRVTYPDRYMDKKGKDMWGRVIALLEPLKEVEEAA